MDGWAWSDDDDDPWLLKRLPEGLGDDAPSIADDFYIPIKTLVEEALEHREAPEMECCEFELFIRVWHEESGDALFSWTRTGLAFPDGESTTKSTDYAEFDVLALVRELLRVLQRDSSILAHRPGVKLGACMRWIYA